MKVKIKVVLVITAAVGIMITKLENVFNRFQEKELQSRYSSEPSGSRPLADVENDTYHRG